MTKKNVIGIAVIMAVIACVVYAEEGKEKGKCCRKDLPDAVKAAIKALFPAGEIKEFKKEKESLKLCEVGIDVNGVKLDVDVACDGTVAEVETNQDINSLPAAVAKTAADKGGEIIDADKEVVYAELKLVKLDTPVTMYEIKIKKDGKIKELKIAPDGSILSEEKKECKEDKKACDKEAKGTCKPGCAKKCCKKGEEQKSCSVKKEEKSCSKEETKTCSKEVKKECSKKEGKD